MTKETLALGRLRPLFWFAALALGGLHAWAAASSQSMNPDGIAYLDIGDAYLRGDWNTAVNLYWSPLYSWLLGLAMRVFHPPMRWEFVLVHIVNFSVYLVALICFEFFWLRLMRSRQRDSSANGSITLPAWAWLSLGYALFLYATLDLIKIWSVTPDMLVAALVFLAAGLIVRVRTETATWRQFALLGAVLGTGYLAKTAMFPLAFVFLGAAFISIGDWRRAAKLLPVALGTFLLIAGPYVAVLSFAKGSVTYGETGKLMYAWHINGVPHPHWQGTVAGAGTPKHPSTKVFDSPPIYEFERSLGGTYPVAYNPAYWYDGVTPHFDWKGQLRVLALSIEYYFDIFFRQQGGLFVGLLLLYFFTKKTFSLRLRPLLQASGLAMAALLSLGIYALVHVQSRYIGAFVVLLWADLLAAVRLSPSREARGLLAFASAIMLACLMINLAAFNLQGARKLVGLGNPNPLVDSAKAGPRTNAVDVASELRRLGIEKGSLVGVIGYGFDAYWARLARVRIVAEMFDWQAEPFWVGAPEVQWNVLQAFAKTGARAIVAERVPDYVTLRDWHRVGNSNYYVYVLG